MHLNYHKQFKSLKLIFIFRLPLASFATLGYRGEISTGTSSGHNGTTGSPSMVQLKTGSSSNHRLEYLQPPVYHQLNGSSHQSQQQPHGQPPQSQSQQHRSGYGPSPGYAPYSGPSFSPAQQVAVPQQPPVQQQPQQQHSHQQSHGHGELEGRPKSSQHGQQFYQQSRPTPPSVPSPAAAPNINHHPLGPHGVKRESPLDLSVKTIRQSADSTADPPPNSAPEHLYYSYHSELMRNKPSGSTPPVYHQLQHHQQHHQSQNYHHHQQPVTATPKVEFTPNFGASNAHIQVQVEKKRRKEMQYQYQLPSMGSFSTSNATNMRHVSSDMKHYYSRIQAHPQEIPRYPQQNNYLKRPAEAVEKVPLQQPMNKLPRMVDTWRQTIDQQIEKRFHSYLSSKGLNGEVNKSFQKGQYPNCNNVVQANGNGAADKRVLSILRNSLETRDAKNQHFQQQQHLQQQQHHQPQQQHHQQALIKQKQQAAALLHQPRYVNPLPSRPHLPPFEAIAFLDQNPTPSYPRLRIPKATDSIQEFNRPRLPPQQVLQEVVDISDEGEDLPVQQTPAPPKGELDGLAAFLAARIRTKAELKQVNNLFL